MYGCEKHCATLCSRHGHTAMKHTAMKHKREVCHTSDTTDGTQSLQATNKGMPVDGPQRQHD